jgi:hypothetical protein
MKSSVEHAARQWPALERITWDASTRVWRWSIAAATPNGPVVRTGSAETYREARMQLDSEVSRLTAPRAWGTPATPVLPLAGRKRRPPRPKFRGPGLA